jgi:hypothetical protein
MFKKMRGSRDPAVITRHFYHEPDFGEITYAELASGLGVKVIKKNDGNAQQRNRDPPEPQNQPF